MNQQELIWPSWFNRELHLQYAMDFIYEQLPFQYKGIDPQKIFLLYFLVGTLKALNADDFDRKAILEWVRALLVKKDGVIIGFASSPFLINEPHVVHSYCAIAICQMLDDQTIIEQLKSQTKEIHSWVYQLQGDDGSIRGCLSVDECDLRMVFSCLSYMDLLGLLEGARIEFRNKSINFINSCMNPDGAYGLMPHTESHGGATYCAVASLKILGYKPQKQTQLVYWIMNRQQDMGMAENCQLSGFQGRPGKVPDSCYSFWCGWTLALLGLQRLIDYSSLQQFIEGCQSKRGGLSRTPLNNSDPIHTLHSILGLMLHNQEQRLDLKHAVII